MKMTYLALLSFVAFPMFASAQEAASSSSSAGTGSSTAASPGGTVNKKFAEESEITDAKIRADSGSRSKYSVKFNLSYYGPTLNDASLKQQPNPDNSNAPKSTALSGGISTRLRLNRESTIGFGTGIKAVTPTYKFERFDINNPGLNYDYTRKVGDFQLRTSPGIALVTTPEYRNVGETGSLSLDQSIAYQVKGSPVFATLDGSIGYYLYNRGYNPGSTRSGGDGNAQRYSLSILPGLKYRFTDVLSLATSVQVSVFNPRSQASSAVLWRNSVTQRLALGWAITRDIYVQPYLDIYPQALAIDTTTMNISTVFSVL